MFYLHQTWISNNQQTGRMEHGLQENISVLHFIPAIDSLNHLEQLSQQPGLRFLTYKMGLSMKNFKICEITIGCSEEPLTSHYYCTLVYHWWSIGKIRKQYPEIKSSWMCYVGSGVLDKILRLLAHSHANSCPLSWCCYPTVSFSVAHFLLLPSVFPSIRVFSNESVLCIRWPKYWSFNFSISPSNEYSWLISIRIDWFDLLAIQGTLKSLLQYTTVQNHQFFGAQPSFWSRCHICTWLL